METPLSPDAEASLADYHHEKIKHSHDWHWKEWMRLTGLADFTDADWGEEPKQ